MRPIAKLRRLLPAFPELKAWKAMPVRRIFDCENISPMKNLISKFTTINLMSSASHVEI